MGIFEPLKRFLTVAILTRRRVEFARAPDLEGIDTLMASDRVWYSQVGTSQIASPIKLLRWPGRYTCLDAIERAQKYSKAGKILWVKTLLESCSNDISTSYTSSTSFISAEVCSVNFTVCTVRMGLEILDFFSHSGSHTCTPVTISLLV